MKIGHLSPQSNIYGPGTRFVIWTQGCSIQCPGCWNENLWEFGKGKEYGISELMVLIQQEAPEIEGVTILGGEPFDQPEELLCLAREIQTANLTLMVYSGYSLNEIKHRGYPHLLPYCDILIEGRYNHALRNTSLRWRGSSNQRVLFFTPHYSHLQIQEGHETEIVLDENGEVTFYGYPEPWMMNE